MKTLNKKSILMSLLFLMGSLVHAQETTVEMADSMRAEGKIYVVVAIILVILFGFIGYLFILDRKIGKLEKQLGNKVNSKN